jgi:hypothetical protein
VNNNITGGINTISITTGFNNVTQNSVNVGAVGSFNAAGWRVTTRASLTSSPVGLGPPVPLFPRPRSGA